MVQLKSRTPWLAPSIWHDKQRICHVSDLIISVSNTAKKAFFPFVTFAIPFQLKEVGKGT
ncbi:hypothetical protein CGZ80_06950 [Rhodopirellula sp. MGV]|nr:hypothetical protein CGZ80_06950 [Rhodopirellula sp. MGV]PNY37515.1 hypothetical protein C2E31_07225 [Rhodopirellula baltica]